MNAIKTTPTPAAINIKLEVIDQLDAACCVLERHALKFHVHAALIKHQSTQVVHCSRGLQGLYSRAQAKARRDAGLG
ncbi:MAG: hypothetical protein WKF87_12065 [Chryseolinea sp.]